MHREQARRFPGDVSGVPLSEAEEAIPPEPIEPLQAVLEVMRAEAPQIQAEVRQAQKAFEADVKQVAIGFLAKNRDHVAGEL